MNKGRRIAALAATTMTFVGMTSMVAAPANATTTAKGPKPVSILLDTVDANDPTFVEVSWTTDKKVCDFKLKVWGTDKVTIKYPESTKTYSSFSQGSKLKPKQTDYTAFRVTAKYSKDTSVILPATMSYNYCGKHDKTMSKSTGFLLPVNG